MNDIQNKVRIHENVGELFGGIQNFKDFKVDTSASIHDVEPCQTAELYVRGDKERVRRYLREQRAFLHPIEEEVINLGGERVPIEVIKLVPSRYPTLVVTGDSEINFLSSEEYRDRQPDHNRYDSPSTGGGSDVPDTGETSGTSDEVNLSLSPTKPVKSFNDDVAGLEDVKKTIRSLLALFDVETREEVKERYGRGFVDRGNSMLLYGPPGCGKTLVSEAIAYEAKNETRIPEQFGEVKYFSVKGGDILSKYSGEAEKRVESVFEQAHKAAQEGFAVLMFDEVETLVPDRSDDSLQRHERSLTNAFLQEMNDIEDNLLVIGATNMPFTMDPAATRRFPIQQFIPQPGSEVMADVWRTNLNELATADEIDFDRLGHASTGYTPAEIADRILGSDLKRELVQSVIDGDPIDPDTEYLLGRLEDSEPKTVKQYVSSVVKQANELEGFPALKDYVTEQVDRLEEERA
jgi:transitional endoplasmic reticulum ATPase